MTPELIGLCCAALLLVLLAIRVPIGVALGSAGAVGLFALRGAPATLATLGSVTYDFVANWELTAIPMFILMGAIAYHSGLAANLFRAARAWLSFLPGGLAISTNLASAGFAAACGSSVAMTGAMARLAIPEMTKAGYDKGLAAGSVASAGTLGALIPPSIPFILYGVFMEASVGKLLLAGLLPGILTMLAYTGLILLRVKLKPALAPRTDEDRVSWPRKWRLLARAWPVPVIILGVAGGLYSGAVTATETGAFGAVVAIVAAIADRAFSWRMLRAAVEETVRTTSAIFLIALGAVIFTRFLNLSRVPMEIGMLVGKYQINLPEFLLFTAVFYLVLGMFLDPIGLMLVTLPILQPMASRLNVDLIWFGVIVVKFIEIGLLTPPVGLNLFVTSAAVGEDIPFDRIVRGTLWFLCAEAVVMMLIFLFPSISLFIPSLSNL